MNLAEHRKVFPIFIHKLVDLILEYLITFLSVASIPVFVFYCWIFSDWFNTTILMLKWRFGL